MSKNEQTLY